MLYDAGRLGGPAAARRAVSGLVWSEGLRRIDTLVLSHADADHFNAVPDLITRFRFGRVVVPQAFLSSTAPSVIDLLARLSARRIPVVTAGRGDEFALSRWCRVRVLHPGPAIGLVPRCDNQTSLVLAVESSGRRLLLTGDLEGQALRSLVAEGPGECDVLVAPHHGTRTSLPPEIARATAPRWVIVSGPGGRAWPEVAAAYAATASAGVLKTGDEGALALSLSAAEVTAARFKNGRWRAVLPTPAGGSAETRRRSAPTGSPRSRPAA